MNMPKSPFSRVVGASSEINNSETNNEDRIVTIPTTTMTAPRPILAAHSARKLLTGSNPVSPWVAATFATDMEGAPGRLIDKIWPNSRLGTSDFGAKADPIADTMAVLQIGGAAIFAPRMPIMGRAAVATAIGHEGFKGVWALRANKAWKTAGGDGNLYIPPTQEGKCSMAEKMSATGLAVLASDFDDQRIRQPIAGAALALSVMGTLRGENERQHYAGVAQEMIAGIQPDITAHFADTGNLDPVV